jgi:cyclopropane fatty-acyl-phospholipid synthase-like methyltransferase
MYFDPRRLLARSAVYSKFGKLISNDSTALRLTKDFLKIEPGDRVLDIGCGPAGILANLPNDVDYHGYDIEPRYIEAARKRYGTRGTFFVASVSPEANENMGLFDVAMAIGVLHHLTDDECAVLLAGAAKVLKPGGRLVTLDGVYVQGQNPVAKLLLALDRGRFVRQEDAYTTLARRFFGEVKPTILTDLLAIPYTHLVMDLRNPH